MGVHPEVNNQPGNTTIGTTEFSAAQV